MGFTEIDGPMIQSSFWNFDILFTPQDHSAREMHDTFYVSGIKENRLPSEDQIKKISEIHRNGWKYEWNIEEAKRIVLRTHTTSVTINYLAENKPEKCRIFSIGRGGGLERIAMLRFGLNDVRDLYRNDLRWLRSVPFCQL
jgi:phenylalanyl-tRNA synthetase alpha chain